LKAYAKRFKAGKGWRFLTGKKDDTTLLRKKLGLFRDSVEASNLNEHSTSFMMGNERTGQWIKRSPFDEPKILAWTLDYSLSTIKTTYHDVDHESYKSAQKLSKLGRGEDLFRFRCAACHSLGNENGLGPGLLGVTDRREKSWLTRWIKTPDKLLAKKDPIALSLFEQYNKVLMPNLRLSDSDVAAIIQYMEDDNKTKVHAAWGK
jgi:protein SCO1/2